MDSYEGKGATVIGWGKTSGKQNVSSVEILKELERTVVSQKECQETFGSGKDKVELLVTETPWNVYQGGV